MSADEILKATTPNALAEASPERLDHLYNVASGLLLTNEEGVARQIQNSIAAIHAERSRRLAKRPKWIEWAILIVTVIGVLVAVASLFRQCG